MGHSFPPCRRCGTGELLPLSDYGPNGAGLPYKAWVCTNPACGFNLKTRKGTLVVEEPMTRRLSAAGVVHPAQTEPPLPPPQATAPVYRVGGLYDGLQTVSPTDASAFCYRHGQFELVLMLSSPRSAELRDVGKGLARFALFIETGVVVLLTAFGDSIEWGPSPFLLRPCEQEQPSLPPAPAADERDRLVVVVVDAGSRVVRAVRDVPLPAAITGVLRQRAHEQATLMAEAGAYERTVAHIEEHYPTNADLVRHAVVQWNDEGETGGKPWRR